MATKDLKFDKFKDNLSDIKNDSCYSNLNLNGVHKCSTSFNSFLSKNISKKSERKIAVCFTDNKNNLLSTKNDIKKRNKNAEKQFEALLMLDYGKKIKQKQVMEEKDLNNTKNKSTLSLHIAAYENSYEDSDGIVGNNLSNKNNKFGKTWKGIKNIFNGSGASTVTDSFEIPRQQENQVMEPEIMQFKASQKLQDLKEKSGNGQIRNSNEDRQKAGADAVAPPTTDANNANASAAVGLEPVYATTGVSPDKCDSETLIKNLWGFLVGYEDQPPPLYLQKPLLHILREALAILQSEPTVIDLQGVVTIIGGVHGHGDSLTYHMSYSGIPPTAKYIFLGNYVGEGFAPHECLFLLLALKVKFPKHIYLLKGCFEDPDVLKGHDFIGGLQKRGLMEDTLVWCYIEQIMHSLPLAAILNDSYLCLSGGIGPELMKVGIPGLRSIQRPPTLTSHISIVTECQWACLKLPGDSDSQTDGSPMFTEEMITKFCAENKLRMIIRSRQLVAEGILNFPEQMITLWTPVSFLDSFRNASVSLRLNGENHKASIMRYNLQDREPGSLDDWRPTAGRNAMTL